MNPRRRALQLARQRIEQPIATEPRTEMGSDGQTLTRPPQRHGHRRPTRCIECGRERSMRPEIIVESADVGGSAGKPPERRRGFCGCGRQQNVEVRKESTQGTADAMQLL